jgi:hypothetical protein
MLLDGLLSIGSNKMIGFDSGVFYKECQVCNESKQTSKFRLRTESKVHSRRPFCLSCEKASRKVNYLKNKKERVKNTDKYRLQNWRMKMLWQAKSSAAIKNIPFNLEECDIIIPTRCKYLDVPLTRLLGEGVVWSNTSLDRIDSSLGYVKGNVEVISRKANSMKNMATVEELKIFAKNILTIYGE